MPVSQQLDSVRPEQRSRAMGTERTRIYTAIQHKMSWGSRMASRRRTGHLLCGNLPCCHIKVVPYHEDLKVPRIFTGNSIRSRSRGTRMGTFRVRTSLHSSVGSACIRPRSPSASASESSPSPSPLFSPRSPDAGFRSMSVLCPATERTAGGAKPRPKKYPREAPPSASAIKSGTSVVVTCSCFSKHGISQHATLTWC